MRVNIVSNINNQAGLQKDFELLRDVLVELGHEVVGIPFQQPFKTCPADLNIFLEVIVSSYLEQARRNFFIPNPEWYFYDWGELLPQFQGVLCKTKDCVEIFKPKVFDKFLHFTGFFSNDMYESAVPRERKFLHVAGKSQTKNTPAILEAWKHFKIPYPLTVVSDYYGNYAANGADNRIPNVIYVRRASDAVMKILMNSHQFHIMPSMYEGFGHCIHEAFGCKAVVITTNSPPMNEWVAPAGLMCQAAPAVKHHAAILQTVQPSQIEEAVRNAWALTPGAVESIGDISRDFFLTERPDFIKRFGGLL